MSEPTLYRECGTCEATGCINMMAFDCDGCDGRGFVPVEVTVEERTTCRSCRDGHPEPHDYDTFVSSRRYCTDWESLPDPLIEGSDEGFDRSGAHNEDGDTE